MSNSTRRFTVSVVRARQTRAGDAASRPPRGPEQDTPATGETGGYDGPEPTRYGDWEHKGRCTDF